MQRVKRFLRRKKAAPIAPTAPAAPPPTATHAYATPAITTTHAPPATATHAPPPATATRDIPTSFTRSTSLTTPIPSHTPDPAPDPTPAPAPAADYSVFASASLAYFANPANVNATRMLMDAEPRLPWNWGSMGRWSAPLPAPLPAPRTAPRPAPSDTWQPPVRKSRPVSVYQSSDPSCGLPWNLWTTIWLLMSALDRIHASHVCRVWRERAITAPSLWAEFEYHERAVNRQRGADASNRLHRPAALRAYLERSSPEPFSLVIELQTSPDKQLVSQSLTQIIGIIEAHRRRIAQLVLRNFSFADAQQFLVGGPFPMLVGPSGLLELSTDRSDQALQWTVMQVAGITGGAGPRRLKIVSDSEWSAVSSQGAPLSGVKELLGPLRISDISKMHALFWNFPNIQGLDITLQIGAKDPPASKEALSLFERLRALRIEMIPRTTHLFKAWEPKILEKVLPASSISIEDFAVDLPRITDGQLIPRVFASFRDLNLGRSEPLSLEILPYGRVVQGVHVYLHIWMLRGVIGRRVRSAAIPDSLTSAAARAFWSVLVANSPLSVRNLSLPISTLAVVLRKSKSRISTIEFLEVECSAITFTASRDRQIKVAKTEIGGKKLPPLPQLRKLRLWSSHPDALGIGVNSATVECIVSALCKKRILPVLDVSCLDMGRWSSQELTSLRALVTTLIVQ